MEVKTKKILFADDDPEIREVLRLLLTSEGYAVAEASSGGEVLGRLDEGEGLLLADIDTGLVDKIRREMPLHLGRRTDLYALRELSRENG